MLLKKVEQLLKTEGIPHEVIGDKTIDTNKCTIIAHRGKIMVNDNEVELDDVLDTVLSIERA